LVLLVAVLAYSTVVVVQARRATPEIVDTLMKSGKIVLRPEQFPKGWIEALLRVEDPQFFTHHGIDLSTPGAGLTTITQGLVKQLYFERFTPGFAKLKQSLIAIFALDALVSKDTQLQLFINTVYLGENEGQSVNGFAQGAQAYFGKRFEDAQHGRVPRAGGHDHRSEYA
jgi:membrane carboxypeptidase/penicillin-binding protein